MCYVSTVKTLRIWAHSLWHLSAFDVLFYWVVGKFVMGKNLAQWMNKWLWYLLAVWFTVWCSRANTCSANEFMYSCFVMSPHPAYFFESDRLFLAYIRTISCVMMLASRSDNVMDCRSTGRVIDPAHGMIHTKIYLICSGCHRPSIALRCAKNPWLNSIHIVLFLRQAGHETTCMFKHNGGRAMT